MSDIIDNELISVAMEIILNAGDARNNASYALEAVKVADFELANKEIAKALDSIRLAHIAQTKVIQDETRGIQHEPCLLFAHAQDTLMTINSEIIITRQIIDLFEIYENKLANLTSK